MSESLESQLRSKALTIIARKGWPPYVWNKVLQRLLKFNQIWVVSEWQKNIYIKQGIPKEKIKVVREGVDSSIYYPRKTTNKNGRFKFIVVGRWEYRKATKEIIETKI